MAGKEIYIGQMLDTLNTKLDLTILELQRVKTAVGSTVTSLYIDGSKEDDVQSIVINSEEKTVLGSASPLTIGTWKCYADGTIKVRAKLKASANNKVYISKSINSAAATEILSRTANTYGEVETTFAVTKGDSITLTLSSSFSSVTAYLEAGATFEYNIISIASEGALIKTS